MDSSLSPTSLELVVLASDVCTWARKEEKCPLSHLPGILLMFLGTVSKSPVCYGLCKMTSPILSLLASTSTPISLTNLEGETTIWSQRQKKEQPSKASSRHLNNEGVRQGLLNDAIFSSKFLFHFWCSSIILTWAWEPSGDSDWAIMWPWSLSLSLHKAQFSHLWNGYDNS